MQNIDSMISHPAAVLSSPFVDVFSAQSEELDRVKSHEHYDAYNQSFGSSSGIVQCKLCLKTFTSVSSHQNHMKTIHREMREDEMHRCRFCDRFFKLKIYLNRHIARVHGNNLNKRQNELNKKPQESIFNKDDVSLYCEVWSLSLNSCVGPLIEPFVHLFQLCKQFFTTRGSLQKHVRVKHEFVDVNDRFVCDHCGSAFLIKYYLIRHIRVRHLRNFIEKKTWVAVDLWKKWIYLQLELTDLTSPHRARYAVKFSRTADFWNHTCDLTRWWQPTITGIATCAQGNLTIACISKLNHTEFFFVYSGSSKLKVDAPGIFNSDMCWKQREFLLTVFDLYRLD